MAAGKRLKIRGLGVGGTVAEFERTGNKPDVKVKWKVGSVSGAGKGNRKTRKHGPGGKAGRLRLLVASNLLLALSCRVVTGWFSTGELCS